MLHFAIGHALKDRSRDAAGHQPDRAQRVVVRGDREVDQVRVGVGVAHRDDRDLHAVRFLDSDRVHRRVDDEDGAGQSRHISHSTESANHAVVVAGEVDALLLRERRFLKRRHLLLQLLEVRDALRDRGEIGERAAEPSQRDVRHAAARGLGHEDLARLPLGTDEEHRLASGDDLTQLVECALKERNR